MERYIFLVILSKRVNMKFLIVTSIIYWFLSIIINIKCRRIIHIQEIEIFLSTSMSLGEFLIKIITNPFFLMLPHLGFTQMLDRSGFRSWCDWRYLRNHIYEWNKNEFGPFLSYDLLIFYLSQP